MDEALSDDKAGILVHLACLQSILSSGELPVNVKVIIEGEEECSSPHLAEFMKQHQSLLKADVVIVMDLVNYKTGLPSLTTSLRGMVSFEITVSALKKSLHSGMWGGPIPDPIIALAKIISSLTTVDGSINIPALYKKVRLLNKLEARSYELLEMTPQILKEQAGVLDKVEIFGQDEGNKILKKLWREPSLVVNAIESGGKDIAGNVLMDRAWARIGIRIVPDQAPEEVFAALKKHIDAHIPWGVSVDLKPDPFTTAWITNHHHPIFNTALKSLKKGYGKDVVIVGCGGSIPFVSVMQDFLGDIPLLLTGIEDPYTNAHGENESQHLGDLKKAILSEIHFLYDLMDHQRR